MILGPVQLVLIGLPNEKLKGRIARELYAASEAGNIRVLDALAIQKQDDGTVVSLGASDLTPDQRAAYGALIGGLIGYGAAGEEGAEAGAEMGAAAFADRNFGFSKEDIQATARGMPAGTTGVMVMFEHRWAIPLKEAVQDAGGVVLAQGMVQPETLIGLGAELAAADIAASQIDSSQSEQQLH
jgi:uncharacterized membrane protein